MCNSYISKVLDNLLFSDIRRYVNNSVYVCDFDEIAFLPSNFPMTRVKIKNAFEKCKKKKKQTL